MGLSSYVYQSSKFSVKFKTDFATIAGNAMSKILKSQGGHLNCDVYVDFFRSRIQVQLQQIVCKLRIGTALSGSHNFADEEPE